MKLDTLFKRVNKDIFRGELETPIFVYGYDVSTFGFHTIWEGQHIICIQDELPWFFGATTMAHEMVHQWQYDNGIKLNHGQQFKKMARKIETYYNLREDTII